ncbi:hypothetical protein BD626DRAFT_97819 [Schizophyllum amplum]|uniref:Uncharacterized protein n=1 Tax=Schizophyllum amplum TaxID=97359 RepID=A0A550BRX3_9AGAR|nr:hypothetical protein BD626DRAFT_97819 [Auriculariopsis ampla]
MTTVSMPPETSTTTTLSWCTTIATHRHFLLCRATSGCCASVVVVVDAGDPRSDAVTTHCRVTLCLLHAMEERGLMLWVPGAATRLPPGSDAKSCAAEGRVQGDGAQRRRGVVSNFGLGWRGLGDEEDVASPMHAGARAREMGARPKAAHWGGAKRRHHPRTCSRGFDDGAGGRDVAGRRRRSRGRRPRRGAARSAAIPVLSACRRPLTVRPWNPKTNSMYWPLRRRAIDHVEGALHQCDYVVLQTIQRRRRAGNFGLRSSTP